MSVSFECCVLSDRGLCDELITRPEESYRLWWVVLCDLETSWMSGLWPTGGHCVKRKKWQNTWSQWRWGLRWWSAASWLLGLWVWIPPGASKSVSCDCCMLSVRGLCVGLIARTEDSYRLWCVYLSVIMKTLAMRRPWPTLEPWERKRKESSAKLYKYYIWENSDSNHS